MSNIYLGINRRSAFIQNCHKKRRSLVPQAFKIKSQVVCEFMTHKKTLPPPFSLFLLFLRIQIMRTYRTLLLLLFISSVFALQDYCKSGYKLNIADKEFELDLSKLNR
jgi:hypothetical protein